MKSEELSHKRDWQTFYKPCPWSFNVIKLNIIKSVLERETATAQLRWQRMQVSGRLMWKGNELAGYLKREEFID